MPTIILAITGASGAAYAVRLLETLLAARCSVHLCISDVGRIVLREELDCRLDLEQFDPAPLRLDLGASGGALAYHHFHDFSAPIASGSFPTDGMVVCPCSGGTLAAIANGLCGNLIHRAAEVHLKERRRLILVPRETPLSLVHLKNMQQVAEAGAVVLPASPGFYHGARQIADLVDFVVARICDQLGIATTLVKRWGEQTK
jgi:flavin prenyltransferase